MTPKTAGLLVAAALATGWLMGNSVSQEAPAGAGARRQSGPRPLGSGKVVVAPYTQKLRERLKEQQPATPARGRNPFVYGSRTRPSGGYSGRSRGVEPEPAPAAPLPVEPPAPVFKLSGVATNQENGAAVFTAIIIDNGSMVFAVAGDKLSNGYTVVRVDEMSVTLADAGGITQTLRLP